MFIVVNTESIGCNETENIKPRCVPVNHKNRSIATCNNAGTTVFGIVDFNHVAYICTSHLTALNTHAQGVISVFVSLVIIYMSCFEERSQFLSYYHYSFVWSSVRVTGNSECCTPTHKISLYPSTKYPRIYCTPPRDLVPPIGSS